jgi:hypothetical protein
MTDEQRPSSEPASESEDDTEGQAFTWTVVDDPTKGRRLRQEWTPDDPQAAPAKRDPQPAPRKHDR